MLEQLLDPGVVVVPAASLRIRAFLRAPAPANRERAIRDRRMSSIGELDAQSRLARVEVAARSEIQAPVARNQVGRSTKGRASGHLSMEVEP